jgi:hypothetical protein
MNRRLLFASIHSYLDPSSGASLATREVLQLLAARGWDCRALTCGVLDYAEETPLDDALSALDQPTPRVGAALSLGGEAEVFDLELDGIRVTLLPTAGLISRRQEPPPASDNLVITPSLVNIGIKPRQHVRMLTLRLCRVKDARIPWHAPDGRKPDCPTPNDISPLGSGASGLYHVRFLPVRG